MGNSSSKGSLSRFLDLKLPRLDLVREVTKLTGKHSTFTDSEAKKVVGLLRKYPGGREGCRDFLDILYEKHYKLWQKLHYEFRYELPCNLTRIVGNLEINNRCGMCGSLSIRQYVCTKCKGTNPEDAHKFFMAEREKNRRKITKDEMQLIVAKRRATNLARYGAESPSQNPEVKRKLKASFAKVDWVAAQEKREKTNLEIYGCKNPTQNAEVSAKIKDTWADKSKADITACVERRKDTYEERTGFRSPRQNPAVVAQSSATYKARTGYAHNMQNPDHLGERRVESLRKHGVEHPSQLQEVKDKIVASTIERYGGVGLGSDIVRAKIEATNLRRYGFKVPTANPEIMDKCKATWLKIYGFENPNQNPEQALKGLRASFHTKSVSISGKTFTVQGAAELKLVKRLVKRFGPDNVVTQFDPEFPIDLVRELGWKPDFWVRSIGRFVECKSTWTLMMPHAINVNRNKASTAGDLVLWIVQVGDHSVRLPLDWWCYPNLSSMVTNLYCEKLGKVKYSEPYMTQLTSWVGDARVRVIGQTLLLPDRKVAIEFVPHFWAKKGYMIQRKAEILAYPACAGWGVVFVLENIVRKHRAAARRYVQNLAGVASTRVHARDCELQVMKVSASHVVRDFLNKNHVQGAPNRGQAYCLYKGGTLVAAMLFDVTVSNRGSTKKDGEYELTRFATSAHIPGGASKLLSAFVKAKNPRSVVSYSDTTIFSGNMYRAVGFELVSEKPQDYYAWFGGPELKSKQWFSRESLAKLWPEHFDPDLTERQNCDVLGLHPVWSLGKKKWQLIL
jgi:hypothetical protein